MKMHIRGKKGFTLLEILIVIALTVIIMGLVFGPIVQSFNLTRQAEVMIRAQDNARLALSLVSRDLANAMYVYDNTEAPMNFPVTRADGTPVIVPVYYAKVDMVLPRMSGYCPTDPAHTPGGLPRGEEAAPECPVCGAELELKPLEPLAPDTKIVRYFVGLLDPLIPYADPNTQRLVEAGGDNMYILYRAEFSPTDTKLFDNVTDPMANINDPSFFYGPHAAEWKRISRPVVTLQSVNLVRIEYDNNGEPLVTPSVRFMPTAIYNDPLVPTSDAGDDPEHGDTPPTKYKAAYGHWVLPYEVICEPDPGGPYFFMTRVGLGGNSDPDPYYDMCIYRTDRASGQQRFVFNISHYEHTRLAGVYALAQFGAGEILPASDNNEQRSFIVDAVRGTVNCALPVVQQNLSTQLSMAVSKSADTQQINDSITLYPGRHLLINEPAEQIIRNSSVVPGSVKVIGPDARLGREPEPVLYTRIPFLLYEPQPNQYSVDPYFDEQNGVAQLRFHTLHTASGNPGSPLPPGDVWVYYEVQNNKTNDAFRASYTTKSLMTIVMGIRVYGNSGRAEVVELTNKVKLRNVRR